MDDVVARLDVVLVRFRKETIFNNPYRAGDS